MDRNYDTEYINVPMHDNDKYDHHGHSDSRTTTDLESLVVEAKQWHGRGGSAQQQTRLSLSLLSSSSLSSSSSSSRGRTRMRKGKRSGEGASSWSLYKRLVDTLLLVVVVVLLLLLHGRLHMAEQQVGGDYAGAGPAFSTKVIKWEANEAFAPRNASEFLSDGTLKTWTTLLPEGAEWRGKPEEIFFTTSMTHQLHCLYMLGRIYSAVSLDKRSTLVKDYQSHVFHCIDYLRQAIMCSADLSMEPHSPMDSEDLGPLDGGWNGLHVCKDYGEVNKYLEEQIADGVRIVLPIDD